MSRNFKKSAALIMAVLMLLSGFAFNSLAVDGAEGGENMNVGLALSAESAKPGDVITVTVSISNNYNAAAMRWPVLFSKDIFELVGEDGAITAPIDNAVAAAGRTTTALADDFVPAAYADTHSAFAIQWYAGVTEDKTVAVFNSSAAVEAFTFRLKVKDSATGTGSVFVPANSDAFYDMALLDPADPLSYYDATELTVSVSDPVSVAIEGGVVADPVLVANDGFNVRTVQFDGDDRTYLCGFDIGAVIDNGEDFKDQFTVNDGTYEVSDDTLATGTVITVYNASGEVFAEYPIIVFGDTNGDGSVDTIDQSTLMYWVSGELEPDVDDITSIMSYYASDVYCEGEEFVAIDSMDEATMGYYVSGEITLSETNQNRSF